MLWVDMPRFANVVVGFKIVWWQFFRLSLMKRLIICNQIISLFVKMKSVGAERGFRTDKYLGINWHDF